MTCITTFQTLVRQRSNARVSYVSPAHRLNHASLATHVKTRSCGTYSISPSSLYRSSILTSSRSAPHQQPLLKKQVRHSHFPFPFLFLFPFPFPPTLTPHPALGLLAPRPSSSHHSLPRTTQRILHQPFLPHPSHRTLPKRDPIP
jgi:hypothetical protein